MIEILDQEAQLPETLDRQKVLNAIPQFEIKPLFKRHHLDRELILGLIGLRGDGKSASSATIALVDAMLEGLPVYSNMSINCDIEIDDETAKKYGLKKGGVAQYRSLPLEKEALLKLDDRYRNAYLVIEEINVQYSNVRRFMTNTNLDFNIVIQQLRKFKTSLIYNVIDEMFIDSQLRTLTDGFIKCEETALSVDGLNAHKAKGQDFKWTIYPMSGYIAGREKSYYYTKKPLPPVYFHFTPFRGIYDDGQFQKKGKYSTSLKEERENLKANIGVEPSPDVEKGINKWGWLAEKALELKTSGTTTIEASELWAFLGLFERGIAPSSNEFSLALNSYGIRRISPKKSTYIVDNFMLGKEREGGGGVSSLDYYYI